MLQLVKMLVHYYVMGAYFTTHSSGYITEPYHRSEQTICTGVEKWSVLHGPAVCRNFTYVMNLGYPGGFRHQFVVVEDSGERDKTDDPDPCSFFIHDVFVVQVSN